MPDELRPTEPDAKTASSDEIENWIEYLTATMKSRHEKEDADRKSLREADKAAMKKVVKHWRLIARLSLARSQQAAVGRTT